jgi:hypothetical protein
MCTLLCKNRCLETSEVPPEWNVAEMFVLYKGKGPVDLGDSYRAISLTDVIGKLFERVIFARALTWFAAHDISKCAQFGFRPHSSTQEAAFTLRGIIQAHKVHSSFSYFPAYIAT